MTRRAASALFIAIAVAGLMLGIAFPAAQAVPLPASDNPGDELRWERENASGIPSLLEWAMVLTCIFLAAAFLYHRYRQRGPMLPDQTSR